jgi:hypothetical protein
MVLPPDNFCLNVLVSASKLFLLGINIVLWCFHAPFDGGRAVVTDVWGGVTFVRVLEFLLRNCIDPSMRLE